MPAIPSAKPIQGSISSQSASSRALNEMLLHKGVHDQQRQDHQNSACRDCGILHIRAVGIDLGKPFRLGSRRRIDAPADISLQDILDAIGEKQENVFKYPRSTAIKTVGKAGEVKIMELYEAGEVDGIISWAGSMGTTTVTYLMRALPFGVPKIMMTDMASSDVSQWLGNKDIYIMNPTAEQGINIVTRKMVANAAAAVVAMAKVGDIRKIRIL